MQTEIIWAGYSSSGQYMQLVAKPKESSSNVRHIGPSPTRYILECGGITQESDHLAWLQTLFMLQIILDETQWGTARLLAEKLALYMNQLESAEDVFYLVNWTIDTLSRDDT